MKSWKFQLIFFGIGAFMFFLIFLYSGLSIKYAFLFALFVPGILMILMTDKSLEKWSAAVRNRKRQNEAWQREEYHREKGRLDANDDFRNRKRNNQFGGFI